MLQKNFPEAGSALNKKLWDVYPIPCVPQAGTISLKEV